MTTKAEVEPEVACSFQCLPQTPRVEEVSEDSLVPSPSFSHVVGENLQILNTSSTLEKLEITDKKFP